MDIADLIVSEISKRNNDGFEGLRSKINGKSVLSKQEFSTLIELLERDPIAVLDAKNPTNKEIEMIGKAMRRCKMPDPDRLVVYLTTEDSKRTSVLLHHLLSKRCRIEMEPVVEYIHKAISSKKILLCHLKLILNVSRGYPRCITPTILGFCKSHKHGISSEILEAHSLETE